MIELPGSFLSMILMSIFYPLVIQNANLFVCMKWIGVAQLYLDFNFFPKNFFIFLIPLFFKVEIEIYKMKILIGFHLCQNIDTLIRLVFNV